IKVLDTPAVEAQRWHFQLAREAGKDPRIRKAVSLAIDRNTIIKELLLGYARPVVSPIPPGLIGHTNLGQKPYDPDKARAILKQAGYQTLTLDFVLMKDLYPKQLEIAQAVAAMLSEVGIKVNIRNLEIATAREQRSAGNYDLFFSGWAHMPHDPDWYFGQWFTRAGAEKLTRFSDPRAKLLLAEGAPQSAVDELNRHLGLREPLWVQYGIFLRSVVRGDFGQSFQYRSPALRVVVERVPATIQLALTAMALTVLVGVSIGIVAAVRQGSAYDYAGTVLAVLGQSLPNFWLGIMLMLLFGVTLRWLPTSGFHGWQSLVLPSVTLAAFPTALVARLTRSSLLEILGQEYIRTGRAKGLGEPRVVLRHALKNATIPLLTVLGLQIGTLLGGAVITESIFAWPGMGKLVVDAIFFRDFPVVQTILILSA